MDEKTTLTIRLPKELRQAATDKAADHDVTLSHVVRWYLRAWVKGTAPLFPPDSEEEDLPEK